MRLTPQSGSSAAACLDDSLAVVSRLFGPPVLGWIPPPLFPFFARVVVQPVAACGPLLPPSRSLPVLYRLPHPQRSSSLFLPHAQARQRHRCRSTQTFPLTWDHYFPPEDGSLLYVHRIQDSIALVGKQGKPWKAGQRTLYNT